MDFVIDNLVKPTVGLIYDALLKHVIYTIQVGDNVAAMCREAAVLKDKCETVKNVIEVQERATSKKCKPEVRGWLERAEGILRDSRNTEEDYRKRNCMLGTSCSLNCLSNHSIGTRATEVRRKAEEELKLIAEVKDFVQETVPLPVQEMNTGIGSTPAGGQLEALLNKSLSFVRDDGEKGTLGICGMGGVGKTTLLKLINNSLASDKFIVVFVFASCGCTEKKLQELIADNQGISKEGDVSKKIFELLRSKDFVLLIDNLWEPVSLENVGIPHPLGTYEGHKRKVILTTRSLRLCAQMGAGDSIIKMECLKWDEAWALFRKNVGEGFLGSNPQIVEVAQRVARECGGLPLALVQVGQAMALNDTVDVWEDALDKLSTSRMQEITDMSQDRDKDPVSLLKISYDYLPTPRLKDCFLHSALWSEGSPIEKDDLIECWTGHGLLLERFDTIGEVYREGHATINALLKACLLENVEEEIMHNPYDQHLKSSRVKMHDLTRDMALWVARDCGANKKKWLVSGHRSEEPTEGTDKISIVSGTIEVLIPKLDNLSNITTLIIRKCRLDSKGVANIQYCSLLKYLDLSSSLETMPVEICKLDKLEHLNLSFNIAMKSIPEEAKNLMNLKYLYIRSSSVRSFGVLKSLEKLLVLDISTPWIKDDNGSEIINHLRETSTSSRPSLKALGINVHTAAGLKSLAGVSSVTMTALYIKQMENTFIIHLLSDDFLGRPHMCSDLKKLCICDCGALEELVFDEERVRMGANEELWLGNLEAMKIITWRGVQPREVFPKLRNVVINFCKVLEDVSWVALLPCLERLTLMHCWSLRCIVGGKIELHHPFTFRSLRSLKLYFLPGLTSISEQGLGFPSLEFVQVTNCHLLTNLPFGLGAANSPKLQRIVEGRRPIRRVGALVEQNRLV